MAFRSQKTISAFVVFVFCGFAAAANPVTIEVRHRHLRKGEPGEMRIGESSISFREIGKGEKHSREWAYDEIQQLYISADSVRILTYQGVDWKLGSDREYQFDELPDGAAQQVLDAVRAHMDARRLVAALPNSAMKPRWLIKAKRLEGRGSAEGILLFGEDSIVFQSEERNASRTWDFIQIENVSSAGPFDLTITTYERSGARFAGRRDFRFQLKTELSEDRYNALWHRLNEPRLTHSSINTDTKEKPNE